MGVSREAYRPRCRQLWLLEARAVIATRLPSTTIAEPRAISFTLTYSIWRAQRYCVRWQVPLIWRLADRHTPKETVEGTGFLQTRTAEFSPSNQRASDSSGPPESDVF